MTQAGTSTTYAYDNGDVVGRTGVMTWDNNGQMLTRGQTFAWDAAGHMTGLTNGGTAATYIQRRWCGWSELELTSTSYLQKSLTRGSSGNQRWNTYKVRVWYRSGGTD